MDSSGNRSGYGKDSGRIQFQRCETRPGIRHRNRVGDACGNTGDSGTDLGGAYVPACTMRRQKDVFHLYQRKDYRGRRSGGRAGRLSGAGDHRAGRRAEASISRGN